MSFSCAGSAPAAARLFRLLGLAPGPDLSIATAAALAGRPVPEVRRLLAQLTGAHLLAERIPGRFAFHDLLRDYATGLAYDTDSADYRHAALTRMLSHYAHSAHAANLALAPSREPMPLPLGPPVPGAARFTGSRQAIIWFSAEYSALDAALRLAAASGFDVLAWQLAWSLYTYLNRQGFWHDLLAIWEIAARLADRLHDVAVRAFTHRALGNAAGLLERYDRAHAHFEAALQLDTAAGDLAGQAGTHRNISLTYTLQNRPDRALPHSRRALELHRATGHRHGEAIMLNMVGYDLSQLGRHEEALVYCGEALAILRQLNDRITEANTWDSLGHAHHHLGHHTEAAESYRQAVTLFQEQGDRYDEAASLANLAETRHAAGDPAAATEAWAEALTILTDLKHPDRIRPRLA